MINNCKRCLKTDTTLPLQYMGQTGRTLRERFGEHRRRIQNKRKIGTVVIGTQFTKERCWISLRYDVIH